MQYRIDPEENPRLQRRVDKNVENRNDISSPPRRARHAKSGSGADRCRNKNESKDRQNRRSDFRANDNGSHDNGRNYGGEERILEKERRIHTSGDECPIDAQVRRAVEADTQSVNRGFLRFALGTNDGFFRFGRIAGYFSLAEQEGTSGWTGRQDLHAY